MNRAFLQGYSILMTVVVSVGIFVVMGTTRDANQQRARADSLEQVAEERRVEIRKQHRTIQRLHSRLELLAKDMASVITAETKRPHEMRPIAWVMRNRVESGRHPDTMRGVLTERAAFTPVLKGEVPPPMPEATVAALSVLLAPDSADPTAGATHYYSPRSMGKRGDPVWASKLRPAPVDDISHRRFRFYRE